MRERVQKEISWDLQVQPVYKDRRENKPVKDRGSQESLPNFPFHSFLAGKDPSCTNETGHKRNRHCCTENPSALVRVTVGANALMSSATVHL